MKNFRVLQMLLISMTVLLAGGCGSSNDESTASAATPATTPTPAPQQSAALPLSLPIGAPVILPRDDSAHDGQLVEWWQWWSHLTTEDGRKIGTMHDFSSRGGLTPLIRDWQYGLRITDSNAQTAQSSGFGWQGPVKYVDNGYDLLQLKQSAKGGNGTDHLHFEQGNAVFDLDVVSDKPPVMLFNKDGVFVDGIFDLHLYQRQRMQTTGWMTENGRKIRVTGTTWFEHGYSTDAALIKVNWDYFQFELADGRNVGLMRLRRFEGGPDTAWQGEIVEPDGTLTYLARDEMEITQTAFRHRDDGCNYPVGWQLRVKDEHFTVTAVTEDQDVPSVGLWDGEVLISGSASGIGAAETSGYCTFVMPKLP